MSGVSQRHVVLVKWSKTPSSSLSFHHQILVCGDESPTITTRGTIFEWGSIVNNKVVKRAKCKKTTFGGYEAEKAMEMGNKYKHLGLTIWNDETIEEFG